MRNARAVFLLWHCQKREVLCVCKQINYPIEKEYAAGLKKEESESKSKTALDNILQFYKENKAICDKAYQYYTKYNDDKSKYVNEPTRLTATAFQERIKGQKILILTANPIERGVLIHWLSEKSGAPLDSYIVNNYSYNVCDIVIQTTGKTEKFHIIHLDPGRTGEEFTRSAVNSACKLFQPNYIVALGVCYGFYSKKYTIGNVFISDSVSVFRINFKDTEDGTIGIEPECEFEKQPTHNLVQCINSRIMYTMIPNILSKKEKPVYAQPKLGKLLSINSLVSNATAKQALIKQYETIRPKPLGGEMEGAGILKSDIVQEDDFLNWLIVKSICDWGEMKNRLSSDTEENERIKDTIQAFAMTNTCSVFNTILVDLCEVHYG